MSRWARYRLLECPRACLLTFFLLIACFLPRRERRYKCFLDSKEEEKGSDCIESFRAMQECFSQHPEHYKVFFRLCLSSHPSAHASHAHTHTHTGIPRRSGGRGGRGGGSAGKVRSRQTARSPRVAVAQYCSREMIYGPLSAQVCTHVHTRTHKHTQTHAHTHTHAPGARGAAFILPSWNDIWFDVNSRFGREDKS